MKQMSLLAKNHKKCVLMAEVLKAIAHPLRLRIVASLNVREIHVNKLARILDCPQAIVSQQLKILRMKHLVTSRRKDGLALYRIIDPKLQSLIKYLEDCK